VGGQLISNAVMCLTMGDVILRYSVYYFLLCIFFLLIMGCSNNNDLPVLKGEYLGQTPPGEIPELFAPKIVSSEYWEHSGAVFTPDGKELFWTRAINEGREPRVVVIVHMKQINGVWTKPELAPFNIFPYSHINSISPDGKNLFFFSENGGAWIVDKTKNGWGIPHKLELNNSDEEGRHINEVHKTKNGNLYFYGPLEKMKSGRGIVCSKLVNGIYKEYESLGSNINFPFNIPYPNHSPIVDPEENFIIFVSRRPGGYGDQDLYISFRQPNDSWGTAINLGEEINTVGRGNSWPQLSPDGKFLFFTSYINTYSEKELKENKYSYDELIEFQKSINNGWGNIYWVSTSFIDVLRYKGTNN